MKAMILHLTTLRKKIGLGFSALVFLLGFGCSNGNVKLDNPSGEKVKFTIDGEVHELEGKSTTGISLSGGKHKVSVGDIKDFEFNVKEGGVLHNGSSDYLTWKILYGDAEFRKSELDEDTLELDSMLFFGDLQVHPRELLYIEGKWDYNVDAPLPESKELYVNKDFLIKSKIFREEDFVETYKKLSKKK